MRLHWYAVQGIKDRVYERRLRGQRGKEPEKVEYAFVDDKSTSKGHNGVTIVGNAKTGKVLAVIPGMKAESLTGWFATQRVADFSGLRSISMDMAPAYIKAVRDAFPHAEELICFDRFHVAQLFSRALDAVRREESAYYNRAGKGNPFAKTRFEWLRNNERADNRKARRRRFHALRRGALKNTQTARVWELKEAASRLWDISKGRDASYGWARLLWRLSHSRIGEMKKLYRTIKEHLGGILNAIRQRASNAVAEARNSAIQRLKFMGCGFWNQSRFIREILYQFGGLVY
jgi:transposase